MVQAKSASAQFDTTSVIQKFDNRVMIHLSEHRTPAQTKYFLFVSHMNLYGNALVPAGLLAGGVFGHDKEMRQNALFVASSSVISYGAVLLIKNLFKRPRPFRSNTRIIAVYQAGGFAFPSGHASSSVSTATAISMAYPKWYVIAPAAVWASSITYSRMYLGLHYPSDVTTGALFGAGTAVYFNTVRKRVENK
ncbi:phosphatase PAP2 family protein [Mucilaginibacter robiniae]|uniref:Phosphatase PAP2 family protein n=2 Tax=Mucilaginibacter robiniae TaxID=2728022 RepID=A0A7L5E4Q5_9SPHI|nr:phosphatase PAP2 family protein [Mucilaginibacter robiniae]